MSNIEEESSVSPLNLPCVPLPIKSLPRFDLSPLPTKFSSPTESSSFKFASPIKLDSERSIVEPVNNFTFSKPISPTKMTSDLSKTLSLSSNEEFDYKNGSVMDFFDKDRMSDSGKLWECNECLIKNSEKLVSCVACKRPKPDDDDNSSDIEIIECPPASPGEFIA